MIIIITVIVIVIDLVIIITVIIVTVIIVITVVIFIVAVIVLTIVIITNIVNFCQQVTRTPYLPFDGEKVMKAGKREAELSSVQAKIKRSASGT